MLPNVGETRKSIRNLLGYAEEILKAGERVVSDLSRDAMASFHEADVAGLDGVFVPSPESDGGWLRVARLHEAPAPRPDETYRDWLVPVGTSSGPFEQPTLRSSLLVRICVEEASDLIEAGLATQDDVMRPKGDHASDGVVDVLLRLTNLTEFGTAFNEWVAGPWADWETAERPRRKSIAFYNKLFEIQQRSSSMGDDTPVEAVFGVGVARWAHPLGRINAPLIEASVELELEPDDGTITVRPRLQAPRLALRPFDALDLPGIGRLQKEASLQLEAFYEDTDVGFSPHERTSFELVLRMCHARIASDAVYEPDMRAADDRSVPTADSKLRITDSWVLYVRQRSSNFRCDDIRRLAAAIDAAGDGEIPAPALQMTTRPTDEAVDGTQIDLTGRLVHPSGPNAGSPQPYSGASAKTVVEERPYFFPLPYNDDQIEIVRRLERPDVSGVVVQGPPGTGKTHTIANIVAHYMATGRRVLVSAHEPEALAAIQDKLPASIRDLAISVIHSDREGARKLEQAVEILASQVKLIDIRDYDRRRTDLEGHLVRTRAELEEADERLRAHADLNLTTVEFRGERLIPMELAARIQQERPSHTWFPDTLRLATRFEPSFGDAEIAEARKLRHTLGRDLVYGLAEFPDPAALPELPRLLAAHAAIVSDNRADEMEVAGDLPVVSFGAKAGADEASALRAWLDEAAAWKDDTALNDSWLVDVYRLLCGVRPVHEAVRVGVRELCQHWIELCEAGRAFLLRGVTVPDASFPDETFDAALAAMAEGRKPFGMFAFGKSAGRAKAQLDAVRVDGNVPTSRDAWTCVRDYRIWQGAVMAFLGKWTAAATAVGFPTIDGEWQVARGELLRLGDLVERMHRLHLVADEQLRFVASLFPYGVDAKRVVLHLEMTVVRDALVATLEREGHAEAHRILRNLTELAASAPRPFHKALQDIAGALGKSEVSARDLDIGWRQILAEAHRLAGLRESRKRLEAISGAVAMSGAPTWAAALVADPVVVVEENDRWTPTTWRQTWEWARAAGHVEALSNRDALKVLSERRAALEDRQRELMAELVRVRTFIGLKKGITERVASALQKFASKVRLLGAGTGKAAERHRRGIREATLEAAGAVPCWILPEWRVAEQLPSELAAFDLVIIDEASQSDITSLPAVLRGKKLLVVGDDKQVSPSAVGMEERTVVQLRETFLRGMDIANFLEPTTSLYDLASMTLPGSVIMLREHFRCVEPIIAFSSRFYPKALLPLRVPTAEERLDPPLVDVYVPAGRKVRDVNAAEAEFIVGEIARLVVMPDYANRTFGIISMIGDKQAKLVQDRLIAEVGTEVITKHRIMCGNASTFQGQERDVIFLSLVACPQTARAQTARLMEQRFNVAMSRARDRMYLVRSVAASMLKPNDLKAAVIEHFRSPMAHAVSARDKEILDEADSDFEREVGGLLLDRGYRLRPQVQVGGYRIDFVVEGEGNRRLAIELDGDRYHGPERWFEDMHRQRALERLGWTFWRCWGSHWLADRQDCLDDLLGTLARLSIEPVGGEIGPQVWTEHRIVGEENGLGRAAQAAAADAGRPVLATVNDPVEVAVSSAPEPSSGVVVEIGDIVIVRFADTNHIRRFRLSPAAHDPERGDIGSGQAIVQALLGTGIEEEVDLDVDGRQRRVIVEKITKSAA
jgi:very-short-patch-repair endonuclease/transcription elongation GreA/GreB family factor